MVTPVAVVGASGRLGALVAAVVEELPDFALVARLSSADRAHEAAVPAGSVAAAGRPRVALSPARQREMQFHQIANSRHGLSRDVRLATWYLRENGMSGLRDKVQNRVRIMRESKNGR